MGLAYLPPTICRVKHGFGDRPDLGSEGMKKRLKQAENWDWVVWASALAPTTQLSLFIIMSEQYWGLGSGCCSQLNHRDRIIANPPVNKGLMACSWTWGLIKLISVGTQSL